MANEADLESLGFRACDVAARTLNIEHPGTTLGPFCRLAVEGTAPLSPGVYAWAKNGDVMYVGKADVLRQIVYGARMQRAYNDYTYMPASKVKCQARASASTACLTAPFAKGHSFDGGGSRALPP